MSLLLFIRRGEGYLFRGRQEGSLKEVYFRILRGIVKILCFVRCYFRGNETVMKLNL